ncbi:putative Embryo defective [Tripterygium wilfordii]|uniref:Putative Embryo defective n=1 Tax=Tripterygium wilfordii TaxID=458696 RepID=A0A7J7D195_TRIWF|nr:uncharacterized protein LOC120009600 [Tripterygium wilfordii]KAF5740093.1 putative Embryo defective [Tripterygium wilfordii]
MALPAYAVFPSNPKFQIKLFKNQGCQIYRQSHVYHRASPMCSMKVRMTYFSDPNKIKSQLNIVRERLWETAPSTVKTFPWKKAENILLEQLLFLGKKVLKWAFISFFILSSIADVIFSIARSQELMIPIGLLVGCLMTDFLKETLHELFHRSKEKNSESQLVGISCFFILVKFISSCFSLRMQVFLMHVANGGLMQVLWLWRNLVQENDMNSEESSLTGLDTSPAPVAEE